MIEFKKILVLIIFDGWGYCEDLENNVILVVNMLNLDVLFVNYFSILVSGLGLDVGLFDG